MSYLLLFWYLPKLINLASIGTYQDKGSQVMKKEYVLLDKNGQPCDFRLLDKNQLAQVNQNNEWVLYDPATMGEWLQPNE